MTKPSDLILVGRVAGAFGVRGEVRLSAYTADPMALADYRDLRKKDGAPALTVLTARPVKDGVVATTDQIKTKEQADALRGLQLFIPRAALPEPEEDEFYLADLIGLAALTPDGETLGKVKAVQDFGAGDILEIAPASGGQTWYVAFTRENVPTVDIAGGHVVVLRPPETQAEPSKAAAD